MDSTAFLPEPITTVRGFQLTFEIDSLDDATDKNETLPASTSKN